MSSIPERPASPGLAPSSGHGSSAAEPAGGDDAAASWWRPDAGRLPAGLVGRRSPGPPAALAGRLGRPAPEVEGRPASPAGGWPAIAPVSPAACPAGWPVAVRAAPGGGFAASVTAGMSRGGTPGAGESPPGRAASEPAGPAPAATGRTRTFTPSSVATAPARTASWPLLAKLLASPSLPNATVSTLPSNDSALVLRNRIQATLRSLRTASRISGQRWRNVSVSALPAPAWPGLACLAAGAGPVRAVRRPGP